MKSSESISNLADALVRANLVIVNPTKDRKANVKMKQGGTYSYAYVGLDTITAEMRPILQAHGLCIVQEIANDGITTRILHSSGEWLEMGPLNLPGGDDAQSRGSASTYGRRYTYCAALGIAADEDDDGAKAKQKTSGGAEKTIAYGEVATGSEAPPESQSGEGVAGKATPSPDTTSAPRTRAGVAPPTVSVGTVSPTAGAPTERVGADETSGPSGAKPEDGSPTRREAQATASPTSGPDDAGVGSAEVTASVEPPAPHRCDFVDWPEKPGGWERCNFPGCNAKQKKRAA